MAPPLQIPSDRPPDAAIVLSQQHPEIPKPIDFLGCPLHPVTTAQVMRIILARAASPEGAPLRVAYLNAHCSNVAAENAGYRQSLNRCDLVYADGQAVVWGARFLGAPVPERVNAGDFILDLCRAASRAGVSLFLLGCAEGLAEKAARAWTQQTPGLSIAGTHHGFFGECDEEVVADGIRTARPDILLVGMSVPRQEEWMDRWAERLGVPVIWCVGALFEYYAGVRPRAPRWMRRAGLEWLFRLALEPGRLWRRYLVGNLAFLRRVLTGRKRRI